LAVVPDEVEEYVAALDTALPGRIEAVYLTGSVALGDYRPDVSDIDLLVVLDATPSPDDIAAIRAVHGARPGRPYLDATYLSRALFAAQPVANEVVPHAVDGVFRADEPARQLNPVTWAELAAGGIAIRGPAPTDVRVDQSALRAWNVQNLHTYWAGLVARGREVATQRPYDAEVPVDMLVWYVLGPPRLLYTIMTAGSPPKPVGVGGRRAAFPRTPGLSTAACVLVRSRQPLRRRRRPSRTSRWHAISSMPLSRRRMRPGELSPAPGWPQAGSKCEPGGMATTLRSWAVDGPITSPFALPNGWLGRLAGRFMLWTNRQDEVVDVLDLLPGQRVLEVGYGPGGLIRLLTRRAERLHVIGVDPAAAMRDLASRTNRAAVRDGRVELRLGTAGNTGLDDASVDRVVSVNNVGLWLDLDAGVRELHRVVRPGGTVVLAWHGGATPSRIARRLRLPADKLDRIEASLGRQFGSVTRRQLRGLDVFVAT
jgi:hypothetical protein